MADIGKVEWAPGYEPRRDKVADAMFDRLFIDVSRERMELLTLVRELSESNPWMYVGHRLVKCQHCNQVTTEQRLADAVNSLAHHNDSCLWLRAQRWKP